MTSENKFGLLRKMLRALGLSQQSADDVVNFIVDLLVGEGKSTTDATQTLEFPYQLRDHFLSPAELSFFEVLRSVVGNRAALCTKVSLGDIFFVKKDDPSRFRIYTNKIDRKHVDFLLCDSATMRPLLGIELDDKSHQRPDRQERDAFVDQVFKAAGLPLLHIPVRRQYAVQELADQLAPFLTAIPDTVASAPKMSKAPEPITSVAKIDNVSPVSQAAAPATETPICPKCGSAMILRTAKSGANAGKQFWGCSNYPNCRSMLPYSG